MQLSILNEPRISDKTRDYFASAHAQNELRTTEQYETVRVERVIRDRNERQNISSKRNVYGRLQQSS